MSNNSTNRPLIITATIIAVMLIPMMVIYGVWVWQAITFGFKVDRFGPGDPVVKVRQVLGEPRYIFRTDQELQDVYGAGNYTFYDRQGNYFGDAENLPPITGHADCYVTEIITCYVIFYDKQGMVTHIFQGAT